MEKKPKVRTSKFFNSNLITTLSISMVLFLVGLITSLFLTAHEMSEYVKENISFSVVLSDDITTEDVQNIHNYLAQTPYAKSTEYIPKENAIKELAQELGENPEDFLGFNPLSASIEVKVQAQYANADSMKTIESSLTKRYAFVREVSYQKNVIDSVNENIQFVSLFLLGVTVILLFISIGIINNTIRLQIYSKRFIINTMKLVGATSWFIRKPFLRKSLWNGIVASIVAALFLGGLIYLVQKYSLLIMVDLMKPESMIIVFGAMLFLGVFISFFSSLFAVGKYLRHKTNDLYYI